MENLPATQQQPAIASTVAEQHLEQQQVPASQSSRLTNAEALVQDQLEEAEVHEVQDQLDNMGYGPFQHWVAARMGSGESTNLMDWMAAPGEDMERERQHQFAIWRREDAERVRKDHARRHKDKRRRYNRWHQEDEEARRRWRQEDEQEVAAEEEEEE
jgi:hypothetical protein